MAKEREPSFTSSISAPGTSSRTTTEKENSWTLSMQDGTQEETDELETSEYNTDSSPLPLTLPSKPTLAPPPSPMEEATTVAAVAAPDKHSTDESSWLPTNSHVTDNSNNTPLESSPSSASLSFLREYFSPLNPASTSASTSASPTAPDASSNHIPRKRKETHPLSPTAKRSVPFRYNSIASSSSSSSSSSPTPAQRRQAQCGLLAMLANAQQQQQQQQDQQQQQQQQQPPPPPSNHRRECFHDTLHCQKIVCVDTEHIKVSFKLRHSSPQSQTCRLSVREYFNCIATRQQEDANDDNKVTVTKFLSLPTRWTTVDRTLWIQKKPSKAWRLYITTTCDSYPPFCLEIGWVHWEQLNVCRIWQQMIEKHAFIPKKPLDRMVQIVIKEEEVDASSSLLLAPVLMSLEKKPIHVKKDRHGATEVTFQEIINEDVVENGFRARWRKGKPLLKAYFSEKKVVYSHHMHPHMC
ncbi:hypothetical protein BDF20DRAFT_250592 [Mycotypha africana]|uniref:uncharacterized protein n=1 Tax=Mycotypha africana TaxID=64632 RepID=UPI0022FFCBF8|nr:uncharacterized protein BDF20DRAFT_250592 [Mycotypha africana]KAI8967089.1 hypothetical protein BDF20DRAFT_250592 [Mycotypha africana]